ncbi:MAG TPA: aminopeptidase P family protein [Gemmatimonadaceae bacterium]|nr:aminopeptidase P family protein [Gemmatimonadaceae bacterium]
MTDPRPNRIALLADGITAAHLDGLLITSAANVQYLSGFSGSSALLVVTARDTILITDFRYQTQAAEEVGALARIVIEPQSLWTGLWQNLAQLGYVQVAGFESAHLMHRDFQRLLEAGSRWQWRPTVDLVEALRERKDATELVHIRAAVAAAEHALELATPQFCVDMTELDVAAVLEGELRRAGSDGFAFPTIVASGPNSALPHARPSARRLERGDFLLVDFGARVDGYCSDITRTFVIGRPTAEQRELYDIVREANARAVRAVRAGITGRDADGLARGYIQDRGYGDLFGHSLGHGIGLEVHEAPRLAKSAESLLVDGAVVTVEPGIYRAGWGGVRIEDDVHLSANGAEVLTRYPRDLIEIG